MSIEKKKLKIEIFSDQYTLISDEKEEHIRQASALVNEYMNKIAKIANLNDSKQIAVLAALRLASKLVILESNIGEMETNKKKLIDLLDKSLSSSL